MHKSMQLGVINAITAEGLGVCQTVKGKKVLIAGCLPGEVVKYRVVKQHRTYTQAALVQVFVANANRTEPRCAHASYCGGCALQHVTNMKQIDYKQQAVLAQLHKHTGIIPGKVVPPLIGSSQGYRHKARLGVRYVTKKQKLLIGFREKNGHFLADLESCANLHPKVGNHLPTIQQAIGELSIYTDIPQIEVAIGDEVGALVIRHMQPLSEGDKDILRKLGERLQLTIYLQPKGPASIHPLVTQVPQLSYSLPAFNLTFYFQPSDFTQINLKVNRDMVSQAINWLELNNTDNVLDLFCGLGNFSLAIAREAAAVIGVEGNEEMVERAARNATLNNLTNTKFYTDNLFELNQQSKWQYKDSNKLLLDPPRSGAQEVLNHLSDYQFERIVYVSCNPATLIRDTQVLVQQQGYKLEKLGLIDMFPNTGHVEVMALFTFQGERNGKSA